MKGNFTNSILALLFGVCMMLGPIQGTDYLIDFTSVTNLRAKVKLISRRVNNQSDDIYVYFDDTTISRYSNQMVEMSSYSLTKKIFSMFGVYSLNDTVEYYYGIVQATMNEILVHVSISNGVLLSIKSFSKLKHVQILKFIAINSYQMLVYHDDIVQRSVNFNGITQSLDFTNFSQNASSKNSISKVIKTDFNGCHFHVIFTILKQVYVLQYEPSSLQVVLSISKKADFSFMQNLTFISKLIDSNQIVVVQLSNSDLYAFWVVNGSQVVINSGIQAVVGKSILKGIYPDPSSTTQRQFIFNDKSIMVQLTSNGYSFLNQVQTNFQTTTFTDLTIFSNSNNSFLSTTMDLRIYHFTAIPSPPNNHTGNNPANVPNTTNPVPTCSIQNCQFCTTNLSLCVSCMSGFQEFEGRCYLDRNSSTTGCDICDTADVCLKCMGGFQLDNLTKNCVEIIISTNSTQNSSYQNQAANQTQNQTFTLPSNNTTVKNDTQATYPSDTFPIERIDQTFNSFSPEIKHINTISSRINSFPAARILLTFLNPLFGVFDDYWYYIYHQDSYPQLKIIPDFMVFIYYANNDRIFPGYLDFGDSFKIQSMTPSNYTSYTHPQIYQVNSEETYFLGNIQQMLFQQYALLTLFFVFVKFLALILKSFLRKNNRIQPLEIEEVQPKKQLALNYARWKILKKTKKNRSSPQSSMSENTSQTSQPSKEPDPENDHQILKALLNYLQNIASLKSILITFIGSNLIFISFNFSTQIRIIFTFNQADRSNMISALMGGFILIAFTVLIFLYEDIFSNHKAKENLEENKEDRRICSQLTYFRHFKSFCYGFVHGFFCYEPVIQYFLLILVKIFLIYVTLTKKDIMRNNAIKVIVFSYLMAGILIDILCLLSNKMFLPSFLIENVKADFNSVNFLEFICIGIIILSLILQLFIEVYLDLKDAFCEQENLSESRSKSQSKTIFMLFRKVVPKNLFKSKKPMQEISIDNQMKIHWDSRLSTPKQTTNLPDEIFLEKLFARSQFIPKDQIETQQKKDFDEKIGHNIKPNKKDPQSSIINKRLSKQLNQIQFSPRVHWSTNVEQDEPERLKKFETYFESEKQKLPFKIKLTTGEKYKILRKNFKDTQFST